MNDTELLDPPSDLLPVRAERHDLAATPASPTVVTIETIMMTAIDRGIDPAGMEKLSAIYEREMARRAEAAFNTSMSSFRASCPAILKKKQASFPTKGGGKMTYNFAPLEEITKIVDPVLNANGLTYHWDSRPVDGLVVVTCTVSHVQGFSRTSSFASELAEGTTSMSRPQVAASTITFGRRQSLVLALGLTTDEDNDARRPDPNPAPDADPDAPKVQPRNERQAQSTADTTPRVSGAELNEVMSAWKVRADKPSGTVGEFAKWAAGVLKRPDDAELLTVPRNWTHAEITKCAEVMS